MTAKRALMAGLLTMTACSNDVTGPAPSVVEDPTTATEPGFVCNEQLETWVTLRGKNFSPLVIDALNAPSSAVNPTVTLTRSATVDGEAAEPFSVTRENIGEDIAVRWLNDETMQVQVNPSLELPPGLYDVMVRNANGDGAMQAKIFGVLPRPTVTRLEPAYLCLAQGGRGLVVEGTDFLVKGGDLPSVEVGDKTYAPSAADGCRTLSGPFNGHELCSSLTIELAENDFEPGPQDVTVVNIAPAACRSLPEEDASSLLVVPPPAVNLIVEELACVTEGERTFVITGTNIINNATGAPSVAVGGNTYAAVASDCTTVEVYGDTFENCTTATFTVPQGDLPAGVHGVVLSNPDPAGCASSETLNITIVPPPTVADIQPEVVCSEQIDNTLTITGSGFIVYNDTNPTVNVGGTDFASTASDCSPLDAVINATAQTCNTLSVIVPAGTLDAGELDIAVTNPMPAGCSSVEPVTLAFVPPPVVSAVVEDATCVETRTDTVEVQGTGFLQVGLELPTVSFGGVVGTALSLDGCTPVPGTMDVNSCTSILVEVAQGTLTTGENNVQVENPAPAQCSSGEIVPLEVYAAPTVVSADPVLFCTDAGDTLVTITGTGFLTVDGIQPSVEIGGQLFAATVDTATCAATNRATIQECTSLTATVTQNSLTSGDSVITVINPEPVACPSSNQGGLLVGGPPTITNTMPMAICGGAQFDGVVTLQGTTFLRVDGNTPTVTVEGVAVPVDTMSGCTTVTHPTLALENCTELTLTIPVAFRDADSTIVVTNPAPADCGSSSTELVLAPTPAIAAVTPLRLCDAGGVVQLDGTNFEQGMEVRLGMATATSVTVNPEGTQAVATFAMTTEGTYDISVRNPTSGCETTFNEQVRVVTGPRAFYVDPPVLYDGISTQVTVYLTGLYGGSVTAVSVIDSMGNTTALTNITFDPNRPNVVQGVVPAGSLPVGAMLDAFDIELTDDVNCSEQSTDLVSITNQLTVSVDAIDAPFGWTNADTAVTVTSADPTPANLSAFEATPRVYLNPDMPQAGDIATELRSVQFRDSFELTGIVPTGLPVGTYDVIVINPDGSVGLLDAAFDVTLDPPPVVDLVSPGSWETGNSAKAITVEGANFRMPTLEVSCVDNGGAPLSAAATVLSSTDTSISATVDTTTLSHLSVCEIRVTNTNDGTYADYAPITVTNPAGNFVSFNDGPSLNVARRAPSVASGRPSTRAQYVYAIGGDSGTNATPLSSIEASPLDRFGRPGAWAANRTSLAAGRTLSGAARVENFIYVLGGHDGTNAMTDVSRAMVLNPLDTTRISNVEFNIDPNLMGGLPTGVYYYRVAPVMSATHPANPGGEMLASERQPVRVPFAGVDIELSWTPYADAAQYRIYRSSMPDMNAGSEELLAVVDGTVTSFVDDGTATITADATPLPLGSLGAWHTVSQLTTARHSHGVAVAADPVTAGLYHLYAVAGDSGAGGLTSIERVSVTVTGPQAQAVDATATPTTASIAVGRWELAAIVGTPATASYLDGAYLYVLGGRSANGFTRAIDIGTVAAGGDITAFASSSADMQRSRSGYASAMANNNIVFACGQNGSPSNSADKTSVSATLAPDLDASSALGGTGDLSNRYLPGFASFSGLMYVVGGNDGVTPASATIDYSILGGTP